MIFELLTCVILKYKPQGNEFKKSALKLRNLKNRLTYIILYYITLTLTLTPNPNPTMLTYDDL